MREIVLDTETTGLYPDKGDRVIEIAACELENHLPTGKSFHCFINPERDVPAEAVRVHGITEEFLKDKPKFEAVANDFLEFIQDSKLVIHNAAFDMGFLNAELARLNLDPIPATQAIDTLKIARKKFPTAQNSLDALCKRFGIDLSVRTKHSALVDTELLAKVYLELCGGRQTKMELMPEFKKSEANNISAPVITKTTLLTAITIKPTENELQAHKLWIDKLKSNAIWSAYKSTD